METVLLFGSRQDGTVTETLLGALRGIGQSVLHVGANTVALCPPDAPSPDFLVLERETAPELHLGGGVLVFKQQLPPLSGTSRAGVPGGFSAVVDSAGSRAVRLLTASGLQTVTCGMSLRDTLTFSSLSGDTAVVTLQRALRRLDGTTAEAGEFPVRLPAAREPYAVLASAAVLLLCGRMPENGLTIL